MADYYAFDFSEEEFREVKLALDHFKNYLTEMMAVPFFYGPIQAHLRAEMSIVSRVLERCKHPVVIDLDDMEKEARDHASG
ncbi:MAG: hypothetical protein IIZ96_02155 [Oscillospiraceae bacterium]|nr:hypothetical protein [Oscillospiraceae bacterium]